MPDRFDLADVLPYAVVRTGHALDQAFAEAMAREGLTVRQFGILAQFAGRETTTAAQIARALGVTPQSIGYQVDAMERRGLLTRTPQAGRGRPIELRLTGEGGAALQRALTIAQAEQERLTSHMTDAEQRTMAEQLGEMARRAAEPPDGQ